MTENPLEFHESHEHAKHAAESGDAFISRVSITIALLAVITAIIGSVEALETAGAILESNKATLQQALASDQWAYFQAKGIKKRLDEMTAQMGGSQSAKALEKAQLEGQDQKNIEKIARQFEKQRDKARESAESHENRHPKLTFGAALLQISIAVSTVAIITRRRWPWFVALMTGTVGVVVALSAFFMS